MWGKINNLDLVVLWVSSSKSLRNAQCCYHLSYSWVLRTRGRWEIKSILQGISWGGMQGPFHVYKALAIMTTGLNLGSETLPWLELLPWSIVATEVWSPFSLPGSTKIQNLLWFICGSDWKLSSLYNKICLLIWSTDITKFPHQNFIYRNKVMAHEPSLANFIKKMLENMVYLDYALFWCPHKFLP